MFLCIGEQIHNIELKFSYIKSSNILDDYCNIIENFTKPKAYGFKREKALTVTVKAFSLFAMLYNV